MERHVFGSGRSVSGRRRGSPRRLRNVTLRRKAALFACEMTKNISNKFHFEICLEIFRNREPRFSRVDEAHAKRAIAVRKDRAALFACEMTKNISNKFHFEICLEIFRNMLAVIRGIACSCGNKNSRSSCARRREPARESVFCGGNRPRCR